MQIIHNIIIIKFHCDIILHHLSLSFDIIKPTFYCQHLWIYIQKLRSDLKTQIVTMQSSNFGYEMYMYVLDLMCANI